MRSKCGSSSVGRASASQAEGRGFEPRLPLKIHCSNTGMKSLAPHINVEDSRLINGLRALVAIVCGVEDAREEEIELDFSNTRFISPVFAVSLLVYLSKTQNKIRLKNYSPYMQVVYMHEPLMPDKMRASMFSAVLQGYKGKTYVPVVSFPAIAESDQKDVILSAVEDVIISQLCITSNIAQGLKYVISETIDNITEHSQSERGYIFAQAYPTKGFLDICIADTGITLLGSYKAAGIVDYESDIEAIQAANRRISAKNLPNAENRGFGIYTTKQMLINGLGGQYMILSGEALYMKGPAFDEFLALPSGVRFEGTIVALRIPYQNKLFNYLNYID